MIWSCCMVIVLQMTQYSDRVAWPWWDHTLLHALFCWCCVCLADFGEMTVWWSIFAAAVPALRTPTQVALGALSPIFVSSLLLYVSGIPMLEQHMDEKYEGNAEYKRYKETTPLLIPYVKGIRIPGLPYWCKDTPARHIANWQIKPDFLNSSSPHSIKTLICSISYTCWWAVLCTLASWLSKCI